MLDRLLRDVVSLIIGKPMKTIADLLHSRKHVNEFTIAKKLDITINQTRNILYKLSDQALVSSIRKKDKKKGWYTYFWKIENLKALEFLRGIIQNKKAQFKMVVLAALFLLAGMFVLQGCKKKSEPAAPEQAQAVVAAAIEQTACPVMGGAVNKAQFTEYKGQKVYFCCPGCKPEFEKNPEKYVAKLPQFKE